MSLHEELENLDSKTLGTAVGAVIGKCLAEAGQVDLASSLNKHYPALGVLPDVITDVMQKREPGIDQYDLDQVRQGATLIASVLSEYAQIAELQTNFPDMPDVD